MNKSTFVQALVLAKFTHKNLAEKYSYHNGKRWCYADPGGSEATEVSDNQIKLESYNPFAGTSKIKTITLQIKQTPVLVIN
jgi:hypothetical protein